MTSERVRIRLSDAQMAALECRDGGGLEPEDFPVLYVAWTGDRHLVVARDRLEALMDEFIDLSNRSDAERDRRRRLGDKDAAVFAGRDARSFDALSGRCCREIRLARSRSPQGGSDA